MLANLANSQNLVAIKDVRRDTLLLKNGSICQVLMVGGVNFSLKSEEEQNLLTTSYQNFLNSIDFSMQILVHSRKININHYLDDLGKRLEQESSPLLQSQISEYREFIRQFVSENAIMEKMFLVIVPWHPVMIAKASTSGFKLPFFGKKTDAAAEEKTKQESEDQKEEKMLDENLPQLEQRVNQVIRGLSQVGLDAEVLKNEALIELFFNLYNPESIERETSVAAKEASPEAKPEIKKI